MLLLGRGDSWCVHSKAALLLTFIFKNHTIVKSAGCFQDTRRGASIFCLDNFELLSIYWSIYIQWTVVSAFTKSKYENQNIFNIYSYWRSKWMMGESRNLLRARATLGYREKKMCPQVIIGLLSVSCTCRCISNNIYIIYFYLYI